MITELKPCPFCGGKAKHRVMDDGYHYVICNGDCKVMPATLRYGSEVEAILVWNTRAGEEEKAVCAMEREDNGSEVEPDWVCSHCGDVVIRSWVCPNYCPGCGARVIEQ